jgi:integrase/recombinase XerC
MRYPRRLYRQEADGTLLDPSSVASALWLWVERFQNEFARMNRSPKTIVEYGYDLAALIVYMESVNVTSFAAVTSRVLRDYLDDVRLREEIQATTLNRKLACFRSFFKFLQSEEFISEDPTLGIRKARQRKVASHTYLLAEEARELLAAITEGERFAMRDKAMISLMLFCGLRVAEVAGLNVSDIRFREGSLRVRGKGDKVRELPLDEETQRILAMYIDEREAPLTKKSPSSREQLTPMELAHKQSVVSEGEAVFVSSRRRRITTRAIHMIVRKYVDCIDLDSDKSISPHKLRHTFATLLYLNGADVVVLRELLGHADLSSTQIYARANQDRKKQAMASHPLLKK